MPTQLISAENNVPGAGKAQTTDEIQTVSVHTQNVQGLWRRARDENGEVIPNADRDTTKLNAIVARMKQQDIGAMCIQETWDEGDVFDEEINEFRIFRHNREPGEEGRDHLFRGVALILSPKFNKAWRDAGC